MTKRVTIDIEDDEIDFQTALSAVNYVIGKGKIEVNKSGYKVFQGTTLIKGGIRVCTQKSNKKDFERFVVDRYITGV